VVDFLQESRHDITGFVSANGFTACAVSSAMRIPLEVDQNIAEWRSGGLVCENFQPCRQTMLKQMFSCFLLSFWEQARRTVCRCGDDEQIAGKQPS
jgi:hypothetical protein